MQDTLLSKCALLYRICRLGRWVNLVRVAALCRFPHVVSPFSTGITSDH